MTKETKKDRLQDKEKLKTIKRIGYQAGLSDLLDEGILQYEEEDEDYELFNPFTNLGKKFVL